MKKHQQDKKNEIVNQKSSNDPSTSIDNKTSDPSTLAFIDSKKFTTEADNCDTNKLNIDITLPASQSILTLAETFKFGDHKQRESISGLKIHTNISPFHGGDADAEDWLKAPVDDDALAKKPRRKSIFTGWWASGSQSKQPGEVER